jgi:hypothetical protein
MQLILQQTLARIDRNFFAKIVEKKYAVKRLIKKLEESVEEIFNGKRKNTRI